MSELTGTNESFEENVTDTTAVSEPRTLAQQRMDLCLLLQHNRQVIANKLTGPERQNIFPRSAAMRFISNHSTHELIHKAANAALGLQTFRAIRWGLSALKFARNTFKKA
ncbi:hypothetical protein GCM10011613_22920 [Cellvibrio zantedeschiae]|uniref:Uncharacterized protein n=1 Tax=Cellvibrio zantedeschiae TaxID=1237077 RepID=A0ABQ3B7Q2_9GAMM|nr:hypothetical protein [Cellvibrio zantedeschiae]GGY77757.1 hypothetical protein GCM10011613_22920 [Cellvibrio zantedeschiae]